MTVPAGSSISVVVALPQTTKELLPAPAVGAQAQKATAVPVQVMADIALGAPTVPANIKAGPGGAPFLLTQRGAGLKPRKRPAIIIATASLALTARCLNLMYISENL